MSKHGVRLVPGADGSFELIFDDTPFGRSLERKTVPIGDKLRQTYVAVYDQKHNRQFYRDKVIDQYARIQSFKDECLIENIIKRYAGGDLSVLNRSQGMYGDFTAFPSDPRSAHDLIMRAKEVYDSVPEEEKSKAFDGSFEGFLATFGDNASLARYLESRVASTTTTEEVKSDGKE